MRASFALGVHSFGSIGAGKSQHSGRNSAKLETLFQSPCRQAGTSAETKSGLGSQLVSQAACDLR